MNEYLEENKKIIRESLSRYLNIENFEDIKLEPTTGGLNNISIYVEEKSEKRRYILRIYKNGFNSFRIQFEHDILTQLSNMKLSFEVPKPILSKEEKKSFVKLSNDHDASLFEYIEGDLPKLKYTKKLVLLQENC
eukprot:TRINITY_DN6812_c0_g1_i1.p1 TRINITY_DN6812_c0_g1~~TRINITY_DN6812_c0_g1_i1.p1  ORF type:complete len:135 (-),score=40.03 TRINITY_DN6812_c0_g1_i1:608-1012(-)